MGDIEKVNVINTEKPMDFGDSEAAKLAKVLENHNQSVEYSLQQTIKTEKINSRKLKGQRRNHIRLGPCFKPEKVEEALVSLKECFPAKFTNPPFLTEPEKLSCHWVKTSNKPTNGWTCSVNTRPWFDRLSSKHDRWKKLRIYEFLRLSTCARFPFYDALSAGLVCCWNPCLNVFVTGQGFRTITIEDIAFITGLSPTGIDLPTQSLIDGALDMEKIHPWKNKSNMPFSSTADYYNSIRNEDISRKEEVLFINFAFCKMMMFPSCNVNKTFLKLAANIEAYASDTSKTDPVCLGPLFLGQVYRCLYRLRTLEKFYTAGGPVWIISFWGLFYFPFLAKEKSHARLEYEELEADLDKLPAIPANECCCYGEVAIHTISPVVHLSFEEVLNGILSPGKITQSDWHPFSGNHETGIPLYLHNGKGSLVEDKSRAWMKKAAPSWLLELSSMNIREGDELHWLSVLQPRDLICIEPKAIGVEVYNPNLVARQFGMTQGVGIPFYKTLNRPWGARPNILDVAPKSGDNKYSSAEMWLKFICRDGLSSIQIGSWFRLADVDSGYELWWADFLQRCKDSWAHAIVTLVPQVVGFSQINRSVTDDHVSSGPSNENTEAQTTKVYSPSKIFIQMENSEQIPRGTRGRKRKTEKTTDDITPSEKTTVVEEVEESEDANVTLIQHIQRLPQADHTSSPNLDSSIPNSENTEAETTEVHSPSKIFSQLENPALIPRGTRGQKRKTGKTIDDTTPSKKASVEENEESEDANVTLIQHIQRLPRVDRTSSPTPASSTPSSKSERPQMTIVAGLSAALSQIIFQRSPIMKGQKITNGKPLGVATSSSKKGTTEVIEESDDDIPLSAMMRTIRPHQAVPNSLKNDKIKKNTNIQQETSHDFPENVGTITSEEAGVEPEDTLEPPHEMVRGMGPSIPSENLYDECRDLARDDPSRSSLFRGDDIVSANGELAVEEVGLHDSVTPGNMSLALTIDRSSMLETSLVPSSLKGVSYTPDKALAEVNSVVTLIEDTLHPIPTPSAFDTEKEKAEKIVTTLQNNIKDVTTYGNLVDQIHRLLMASPPQFRPILTHYHKSFMSLQDQLITIQDQENTLTKNTVSLHELSSVAKGLRDQLETSQRRVDELRSRCDQYNKEINELEAKIDELKQLRESELEELLKEERKFGEFSSTCSETIPSLQKVAESIVCAQQIKAQWECTLKTVNDNVNSFIGLLKTM